MYSLTSGSRLIFTNHNQKWIGHIICALQMPYSKFIGAIKVQTLPGVANNFVCRVHLSDLKSNWAFHIAPYYWHVLRPPQLLNND